MRGAGILVRKFKLSHSNAINITIRNEFQGKMFSKNI